MKKRIIKLFLVFLFVTCMIIILKVFPTIKSGYNMYKSAIDEVSVEQLIKQIKSDSDYIKLDEISNDYITLLLESEDKRFYYHPGFDPIAIARAMYNNVKQGYFAQGGSTITQQLAKNLYFSFEKKMERKVAELFVALELERLLTKDEILELYCNVAYYGEGCYGITEASRHYYGVSPSTLTKEQASSLVLTLKCPNRYNPNAYPVLTYFDLSDKNVRFV